LVGTSASFGKVFSKFW